MSKETGGPAFPCLDNNANGYEGMTLRDYFAAKAMQSLILEGVHHDDEEIVNTAYRIAEYMLERRKP